MTSSETDWAHRLAAQTSPEQVTMLCSLTDEQILALEGRDSEQLAILPWLPSEADNDDRLLVALRSLVACGYVTPPTSNEALPVPSEAIADILAARRGTPVVLLIEREAAQTKRWSYSYLYNDVVLEEQVSDDGFHTFVALQSGGLGEHLARLLDPNRESDGANAGEPESFATVDDFLAAVENRPEITQSYTVSQVTMMNASTDQVRASAVYVSPSGVYLFRYLNDSFQLTQAGWNDLVQMVYDMVNDTLTDDRD